MKLFAGGKVHTASIILNLVTIFVLSIFRFPEYLLRLLNVKVIYSRNTKDKQSNQKLNNHTDIIHGRDHSHIEQQRVEEKQTKND